MTTLLPKMSYSAFCESLGCPMVNIVWSWSSINHDIRRALFSVWDDGLVGGRIVMWANGEFEYKKRNGGKEKIRNLRAAMDGRYEVYGILCQAEDTNAEPRKRRSYDDQSLLVLRLADEPGGIVGYVVGETTADAVRSGKGLDALRSVKYAVSDINDPPAGNEAPDRASHVRTDFRRDPAVRAHVLQLANGRCEYCGKEGFLTTGDRRYLEAHHIIALAGAGRDTVDNVIALCAEHHREAHFGANAVHLEEAFQQKIAARNTER